MNVESESGSAESEWGSAQKVRPQAGGNAFAQRRRGLRFSPPPPPVASPPCCRAVENQRFRDDRDPATVKTFLRLANEEVERLRFAVPLMGGWWVLVLCAGHR